MEEARGKVFVYEAPDGLAQVDVRLKYETAWVARRAPRIRTS